ncbi:hypothetical protein [Candidatus Methanocrinis natronophilus]|nr:hypothetical protein [Candidatus Methanocrinis natronophilus]
MMNSDLWSYAIIGLGAMVDLSIAGYKGSERSGALKKKGRSGVW